MVAVVVVVVVSTLMAQKKLRLVHVDQTARPAEQRRRVTATICDYLFFWCYSLRKMPTSYHATTVCIVQWGYNPT